MSHAYFNHQFKFLDYSTTHATIFWILFFQISKFGHKIRGLRNKCYQWLIFQFLEDKDQKIQRLI
jgi:hypothetical protein